VPNGTSLNTEWPVGRAPDLMSFLSGLTGSFSTPAAENPTVAMIEAAYGHHGIDARYLNCEVAPEALGDAVRGARAMGWLGFNCSIPHKVAVIEHLDGLGMLVQQGVISVRHWTGVDADPAVMRRALAAVLAS
jgi:shikimate 5-dehydrogenase